MSNPAIIQAVRALINAKTWTESQRLVEEQRDLLLTDAADQVFADLLEQYKNDPNITRDLQEERALLIRCRDKGIDAAFAEQFHFRQQLLEVVQAFIEANHWAERKRLVEKHRHLLLSDAADQCLAEALEKSQGHTNLMTVLQERRAFLARCRREGIDVLFNNRLRPSQEVIKVVLAFVNANSTAKRQRLVEEQRDLLLTDATDQVLANLLERYKNDAKATRDLQEYRALLVRCRREGIDAAFAELRHREQVLEALHAFIMPNKWAERKRLVETQRHLLLTDATDQFLADLIEQHRGDADGIDLLQKDRALLTRCRREGINAAFADRLRVEQIRETRDTLQRLLDELHRLTRLSDMPRRVDVCRAALSLVNRNLRPERWAMLQLELGNSLVKNPLGVQANNIEQAIHHFHQALEVYTRQAFSRQWANIQNSLALAYLHRIRGAQADNIEQSIYHCQQAIQVYTRQALPKDWAMIQHNLAIAYDKRIRGAQADNIEQAIYHCQQALQVYTRQAFPRQWAMTQQSLGHAYFDRIRGTRADNLEQALHHIRQSLEVYTYQAFPEQWATSQNSLADIYVKRIRGTRADNLEKAIGLYQQILQVSARKAFPTDWATIHNNLAIAYNNRIRGVRADNIEQAIYHYQQVLQVYTRQALPVDWALTQNNLASAYLNRIRGVRADNIEQAIHHLKQALQVYTRQAFPTKWAAIENNLAIAYNNRIRGVRADNIEQAISHYDQALQVRTHQAFPVEWAETQNNLANAYHDRIQGIRADNIEQAISHYDQALEVYTRQAFPEQWANTQNNLASAYNDRIRGSRAENVEQAIRHFRQALEVYTQAAFPEQWANTQNGLANAYNNRIRDSRAENIEQAIHHFRQVLDVYTQAAFPERWAMSQNNLANAYNYRIRGARADNIEQAIHHYQQALEVYTRTAFPEQWANTQQNLATAYIDRIRGDRAENIEKAIDHFQQALKVITYTAFPEQWARSQNNLANAYNYRIRGARADNIEQAIHHCQQALQVYTRQAFPEQWANMQNGLANTYNNRIRGNRADNLEQAIEHLQQALQVYTYEAFPEQWALAQNNLAVTYLYRIRGARGENIELTIYHLKQALQVYTDQTFPEQWARSLDNLGNAYRNHIRGTRAKNLEQAIAHYQQALQVRTRQAFPENWAQTQNNLALAYVKRIQGARADNLEQAIHHFRQALEVCTRQAFPQQWAMIHNNLSTALLERIRGTRADNIEQAIDHLKQALEVHTREAFPEQWAMAHNNLANAYRNRIEGERAYNVEQAIHHYQQALEIRTPWERRDTAYWLGHLLYNEGRFAEARQALTISHLAAEALRGQIQRETARRELSQQSSDLYAELVYCCLQEGDKAAAFNYATAGKGRAFVDMLASAQIDLTNLPDDLQKKVDKARHLKGQLDVLRARLIDESPRVSGEQTLSKAKREGLEEEILKLSEQENELWQTIRREHPDYFATQAAEPFTLDDAQEVARKLSATFVSFFRHAKGWVAFIIRPDDESLRVVELAVTDEQLWDWWQPFYSDSVQKPANNLLGLSNYYDALIAPLHKHLPSTNPTQPARVVLAPFLLLHLLPWAALRYQVTPNEYRYLGDDYVVSITPNLALLKRVVARTKKARRELCAVAYPGKPGSNYLFNVVHEVRAVASCFTKKTRLRGAEATPQAIIRHGPGSHVVHYACHGQFEIKNVEHSGLLLAGGWLRVRDIFNELRLPDASLAVLSACVTGMMRLHSGDELTGLVQAFMYAGTPAVIASLWPVNDEATRDLFEHFYTNYTAGMAASDALRIAQQKLRSQGKQHPYYWAAFQPIGAVF